MSLTLENRIHMLSLLGPYPLKVAYYAISRAPLYPKLCSNICSLLNIMLLFRKGCLKRTQNNQEYIFIVNKAWYLYLELQTCSDKTPLKTTAVLLLVSVHVSTEKARCSLFIYYQPTEYRRQIKVVHAWSLIEHTMMLSIILPQCEWGSIENKK